MWSLFDLEMANFELKRPIQSFLFTSKDQPRRRSWYIVCHVRGELPCDDTLEETVLRGDSSLLLSFSSQGSSEESLWGVLWRAPWNNKRVRSVRWRTKDCSAWRAWFGCFLAHILKQPLNTLTLPWNCCCARGIFPVLANLLCTNESSGYLLFVYPSLP